MANRSPGSRDPRGKRRKPKGTPSPAIDESIKLYVPTRIGTGMLYECPPSPSEVEERYARRRQTLGAMVGSRDGDGADGWGAAP